MSTISNDTLIQGLNEDLAHEYQAVIMYTSYAAMVSSIHRPLLKDFFETEIPEELQHAQFLSQKITAQGRDREASARRGHDIKPFVDDEAAFGTPRAPLSVDVVEVASQGSFPASDPPSWTGTSLS